MAISVDLIRVGKNNFGREEDGYDSWIDCYTRKFDRFIFFINSVDLCAYLWIVNILIYS